MEGIRGIFNIAKGALQANQIALQTVSQNIANVNTPGYTRQKVVLQSEFPMSLTLGVNYLKLGLGVHVTSVVQCFDQYTTRTIHQKTSELSEYESKASMLSHLESLMNDVQGQALSQVMNEFWNAWQDVANNPGGMAERTALLEKGRILAQKFNSLSKDLNQIRQNIGRNLQAGIAEVNQLTAQIAELNEKIVSLEADQTTANDLRDRRNGLLEKLSTWVSNVYLEQTNGSVTVLTSEGILLVDGNRNWELSSQGNQIYWNNVERDVSKELTGGKIGGWLDVRDEIVPQYLANLDELAGTLIQEVNTLHLSGYTLAGETGKYFFENLQVAPQVPNPDDYTGAADYLRLSSDVLNHPENIAAGGQSGEAGDNENALDILNLQTDGSIQIRKWILSNRGESSSFSLQTETLDEYYQTLVGEMGILTEEMSSNQEFAQTLMNRLGEIRDSISGVNLDEELTEMMKFQRAYEAASKLILVGDEMLKSVLEMR